MCICTFRRNDGLRKLLQGLDRQVFKASPVPAVTLVVVDNSPAADARPVVEASGGTWPRHFVHETRPGISHARNAALAAVPAGTEFIAMIDDDEVPVDGWLDQLLAAQAKSGADIVVGPTTPSFAPGAPAWLEQSGFFSKPQNHATLRELDPDPPAATCNVLLRASILDALDPAFDPALALSGGEDKLLFQDLKLRGHSFAWASAAHAREFIPAERATLGYMWREAYRRGCVKYLVKRRLKSHSALRSIWIALRLVVRSIARVVQFALLTLLNLGRGRARWVPRYLQIADSLGTIAGVLHIPNRHYRPEGVRC